MRFVFSFLMAAAVVGGSIVQAQAESLLTLVFTGNSWGYLKPCPT